LLFIIAMELRHLRYFVGVAEELNFSRASARLRVAQPALSIQVKNLETELGVRLLERSSHHVALTAAGEVFLQKSRLILTAADEAMGAARRAHHGEVGRLAIGFIGSISHELLPQLLQAYRLQYPGVELSLQEVAPRQQVDDLLAGSLDVGFVGMAFADLNPGLEVEVLAREPLVAALPTEHPLSHAKSISLARLAQERFILTSPRNAPVFNDWLIGLCRKAGFVPQVAREVDRATTVLNYIAAGFGISIFPGQVAQLPAPGVSFVPLAKSVPSYPYTMAWKKGRTDGPVAQFLRVARTVARAFHS
jgi:DNA-binding transcriptional LysR family regulator